MNQSISSWSLKISEPLVYKFSIPEALEPSESFEHIFSEILSAINNRSLWPQLDLSFKLAKKEMKNLEISKEEKVSIDFICAERTTTRMWYITQTAFGFKLNDDNNFAIFLLLFHKNFKKK